MKVIRCTGYGPPEVLEYGEADKPVPRDNEVLVRVFATTVTAGDSEIRSFRFPVLLWLPMRLFMGIIRPRQPIRVMECSGVLEAVGKNVTRFREGDSVFADTGMSFGAYAEYVCIPETNAIAIKPENMTFEEAAAVPIGGLNALHFLKKARIRQGEKVLVYAASGSIGTFAIQIAKAFGAHVTGVCGPDSQELVRSLGADTLVDYTKEDFTGSGETYDVIFDTKGKVSYSRVRGSLSGNGRYLSANPRISDLLSRIAGSKQRSRIILEPSPQTAADLESLKILIEEGKVRTVIDRRYPLEQVPEAHRYVDKGHKKGNVVIIVDDMGIKRKDMDSRT
ncbi:MAG TPA: NAD(P)-dependent alcohol dehydrogenase [Clostridiaceae bacterium]|nr:NAD(P)-dependent alcohol dehydrogenase [Clostridiaceae bacterium]